MRNCLNNNTLKYIYLSIARLYRYLNWGAQALSIRHNYKISRNEIQYVDGLIFVLAPHSDDEWVGCSQLLSSKEHEVVVCDMDMKGGDTPETHIIRKKEMRLASTSLARAFFTIEGSNIEKEKSLEVLIEKFSPQYICVPFLIDWHKEHREVMGLLNNVLSKKNYGDLMVCMYQVSVPLLPSIINYAKPMSLKKWKDKWTAFKLNYKSQVHIPYVRFALNEYINGKKNNVFASESFCIFPYKEWSNLFLKSNTIIEDMDKLSDSINDLRIVRKELLHLYNKVFVME